MASDLSARSDRALQRAVSLAHDFHAELTVVNVADDSLPQPIVERHVEEARDILREQIASLPLASQTGIETLVAKGHDYREIIALAEDKGAELIVLGIHRHDTRAAFRGTAVERVIRFGVIPVLVVKDAVIRPYRRALVATDLSIHSRAAMRLAARLVLRGELHLVHAVDLPFKTFLDRPGQQRYIRSAQTKFSELVEQDLAQLRAELGEAMPRPVVGVLEGDTREIVRQEIGRLQPDILAVGTHGRTGLEHMVLGSVAEDLLADAPLDVLAVKALDGR
ncbi:MAG: hypothetical protein APF80_04350 [Alphaproteobacteria bacterium BRH_c36]|nr:MAG: hypothetical protein APF80_04350 [Alphaproteobacteria bacterium BRH_c36]